jgi:hypothetical protein
MTEVKPWQNDSQTWTVEKRPLFLDLMNQPIGLLFETEEYAKSDGTIGIKVVPAGFFEAKTQLMAAEILDQKVQPQQLTQRLAKLKHRPWRPLAAVSPATPANNALVEDFLNDDLPF